MAGKADFGIATVLTAPSPSTSGTSLTLQSGHGARLPAAPFYATAVPEGVLPTLDNAEKIYVSSKSTDTLLFTRAQSPTSAKSIASGWLIINAVYASDFPVTADDLAQGTTNLYLTAAERTKLSNTSGTNSGDQTTITGNAGTATKLITARTVRTDLTSTTAVSFDGSTNVTPGVTGTLPVGNGGTGLATLTSGNFLTAATSSSVVNTKAVPSGDVIGTTDTQTLTNKRITNRVVSTTSASSLTPTIATGDQYNYTALAANLTINAPTGTPVDGDKLLFRFKDNGTSRTLTWNAIFRALGTTIPTATTISKAVYIGCVYNAADTKWDVIAVSQEA